VATPPEPEPEAPDPTAGNASPSAAGLEAKILRQARWLRVLTAAAAVLSLLVTATLLWVSLTIQVQNRQILTTLTGAIDQGNRQTPAVIKQLEDDIDRRGTARTRQVEEMLRKLCAAQHVTC